MHNNLEPRCRYYYLTGEEDRKEAGRRQKGDRRERQEGGWKETGRR
jgi:hypothetical protein